jgi:hypothetical protein
VPVPFGVETAGWPLAVRVCRVTSVIVPVIAVVVALVIVPFAGVVMVTIGALRSRMIERVAVA